VATQPLPWPMLWLAGHPWAGDGLRSHTLGLVFPPPPSPFLPFNLAPSLPTSPPARCLAPTIALHQPQPICLPRSSLRRPPKSSHSPSFPPSPSPNPKWAWDWPRGHPYPTWGGRPTTQVGGGVAVGHPFIFPSILVFFFFK
jgi:hypothetical protein